VLSLKEEELKKYEVSGGKKELNVSWNKRRFPVLKDREVKHTRNKVKQDNPRPLFEGLFRTASRGD
jgi:hypothetical protein